MKRKRAPGGGRKPIGSTAARPLTIRMDDELRERLEIEAGKRAKRKRNWNLSQEILMRLGQSLERQREDDDLAMRAIYYLISERLAKIIPLHCPKWSRDPFWFRTFRLAVSNFLSKIEPPGEIVFSSAHDVTPRNEWPPTPESIAEFLSSHLFDELRFLPKPTPTTRAYHLERGDEERQGELYDMERARRHLGTEKWLIDTRPSWPTGGQKK